MLARYPDGASEVIEEWIHTPGDESERILWLCGPAGTGKSSVANTIAERMDSLGRLAASFRFDRHQTDRTPAV
jgi:adenylylsulfate kinase-like enzyme